MNAPSLLPETTWQTSYRHDDGDLIELFYVPALRCAVQYDRMTGYFSADALALAARGIEHLIAGGGRMRLVVGCTLDGDEIVAIEQGYELREKIAEKLAAAPLDPPDPQARKGLESLAWMIAKGVLDVKVAVPTRPDGRPAQVPGIYHEKVGVIADREGNRLSFSGSINETAGGWVNNRESFHVHCSWEGPREARHVGDEVEAFTRLWEDRSPSTKVFDFPEAALKRLLEFLPEDDQFITPPPPPTGETDAKDKDEKPPPQPHQLLPEEVRAVVWPYIRNAARLWNGIRVGEVTSAITPWPHQVRSYVRMLKNWPCRLLVADEVGLGKTISAGLLIRQAWLSGKARRVLIMVPAGVMPQWQNELYEKFNLDVPIYDGHRLRWRQTHGRDGAIERKVGREEWSQEPMVLCSSHLMRRRDRMHELLDAEPWDLVVLDEAHHARRRGAGTPQESGPNRLLQLMREFCSRCPSLMLLTATPMQVHPIEIYDLLNLLGIPASWTGDRFIRYFELAGGNPSQADMEWLAELFRETEEDFGPVDEDVVAAVTPHLSKLARRKVLKALRDTSGIPLKRLDVKGRKAALELLRRFSPVRYRMSRHTRELLRLYHRKGLLDSPIATRDVRDAPVELSQGPTGEQHLYDEVENYISTTYNEASEKQRTAIGFVMTIYRRRLASSFHALRCTLNNRLAELADAAREVEVDEADVSQDELAGEVMDRAEAAALVAQARHEGERESIQRLLKQIAKLGTDSKARRLKMELEDAFAAGYDSAIVFTQYTDTMEYLRDHLADAFPEMPIGCYSGEGGATRDIGGFWTACTKERIKLALKDKQVRILVCTDAAGEGLNLQYTGVVVNYDLPWNPMKVEQRIGRIDRIGQAYPTIRVINLAYKDTVEADVYFALGRRINLFQGIVGKLQPILSRLPKRFEEVALEDTEHREAARRRLLADVEQSVEAAEEGGFDIDEVAQEALELPTLPEPALTLEQIDTAMNIDSVRPPGSAWQPLDHRSYALQLPGMTETVRATTAAEVFDDHCDSHLFLSPGGWLFDDVAGCSWSENRGGPGKLVGHYWLVCPSDEMPSEIICITVDGPRRIATLDQLLDSLKRLGEPGTLEADEFPGAELRVLA